MSGHAWSNGSFLSLSLSRSKCPGLQLNWQFMGQSCLLGYSKCACLRGTERGCCWNACWIYDAVACSLSLSPSLGFVVFLAFLILLLVAIVWNAPPSHCPLTERERKSKCHFQVRGQIELTRGCVGAVVCHSLSFLSHSHTDLTFLSHSLFPWPLFALPQLCCYYCCIIAAIWCRQRCQVESPLCWVPQSVDGAT